MALNDDQRVESFETTLKHQHRGRPKNLETFTNQQLVAKAHNFLKHTAWGDAITPERLVELLRSKWAKKSGSTRSKNVRTRKEKEREAAEAARQLSLF